MDQTEQPTENATTLTGTSVPQDVLTNTTTTLRLPQTMPQVLKIQKQTGKTKQKTRLPYVIWTSKSHKNKMAQNRNKENGKRKIEKYFVYIDVFRSNLYIYLLCQIA